MSDASLFPRLVQFLTWLSPLSPAGVLPVERPWGLCSCHPPRNLLCAPSLPVLNCAWLLHSGSLLFFYVPSLERPSLPPTLLSPDPGNSQPLKAPGYRVLQGFKGVYATSASRPAPGAHTWGCSCLWDVSVGGTHHSQSRDFPQLLCGFQGVPQGSLAPSCVLLFQPDSCSTCLCEVDPRHTPLGNGVSYTQAGTCDTKS